MRLSVGTSIGTSMKKPTSLIVSNSPPDSHTLLGTLPANPPADMQSQSEGFVANKHDEVRHAHSPSAANPVPKGQGEEQRHQPRLITVKTLAKLYGLNQGAIYTLIKTEPDFPYVNVGVKKKFLVDVSQFEMWLVNRTGRQKHEHFAIPTALDLKTVFKNKTPGGIK